MSQKYKLYVSKVKKHILSTAILNAMIFGSFACANETGSDLKISGGSSTNAYPAVVALTAANGQRCSGTFIAGNLALTAAHCIASSPISYYQSYQGRAHSMPNFFSNQTFSSAAHDIAVVVFDQNVAPAIMSLAPSLPNHISSATIVGLGITNTGSAFGTKRTGSTHNVQVHTPAQDVILATNGPGNATGNLGDSGGPILVNDTIVGVFSKSNPTSYAYANAADGINRNWINGFLGSSAPQPQQQATSADLPTTYAPSTYAPSPNSAVPHTYTQQQGYRTQQNQGSTFQYPTNFDHSVCIGYDASGYCITRFL